jgi:hypothetical protein
MFASQSPDVDAHGSKTLKEKADVAQLQLVRSQSAALAEPIPQTAGSARTVTEDFNRRWHERNTGVAVGNVQKWTVQTAVGADPLYQHLLLTAEKAFWRCVMSADELRLGPRRTAQARLEAVRIVDMSQSNS